MKLVILVLLVALALLWRKMDHKKKTITGLYQALERKKDELIRFRLMLDDADTRNHSLTEGIRRERVRIERLEGEISKLKAAPSVSPPTPGT